MEVAHRLFADAAVAGVIVGIGWSVGLVVRREAGGPRFVQLQAAVVAALVVGTVSGLAMLVSGNRPADGLHLLYGPLALVVIPLARSFIARASGRPTAGLFLAAFAVLGAVVYRLFATG